MPTVNIGSRIFSLIFSSIYRLRKFEHKYSGERMEAFEIIAAYLLFASVNLCTALDNGLALTPPMGWMQWQRYRCVVDCQLYPDDCISEDLFKRTADLMVSDGYLAAGYEYVMIDDCWMSFERDPKTLRLQPNATRFPSGIKALSKYIHSKGLKFGIYADYGTHTCGGYPGSLNYLSIDAQTFADWEVDYLKFDGCYVNTDEMESGYEAMGKFLNKTGRPIVYSCSWPAYMEPVGIKPNYTALAQHCNLWRNWDDIQDSWQSVSSIMTWFGKNQDRIVPFAGPGHWNDPDMLLVGNFGLSLEQSKAQMSVWAILAAPLIMSVDLKNIRPEQRELLLNEDVIQINQDPLGKQGVLVLEKHNISIWVRELTSLVDNHAPYAIAFVSHRTDGYPYRIAIKPSKLGLRHNNGYFLKDVFEKVERPITKPQEDIVVRVKPSGAVLLRAEPMVESNSV